MFVIICQDDSLEVRTVIGPFEDQAEAMTYMAIIEDWGEYTCRTVLPVQARGFMREGPI